MRMILILSFFISSQRLCFIFKNPYPPNLAILHLSIDIVKTYQLMTTHQSIEYYYKLVYITIDK